MGAREDTREQSTGEIAELREKIAALEAAEAECARLREELEHEKAEHKRIEEMIRRQAYHDILTGLPNRMLFIDHLKLAITQANRNTHMLAVMFLDLDRFKNINDSLGHAIGDQLLQAVSFRLRGCLREGDTVARLGGDEYTILLPHIVHEEDAVKIAQKILFAFRQPFVLNSHELYVTISIGIGIYPNDGDAVDLLMQNADAAMYHAKKQGRNNYQFYNPAMNVQALRQILLESSLRHAFDRGGFVIYYQPRLDTATMRITGIEALVRWRHPELGLLGPSCFIPLAEETGLIVNIGELVLRSACAQNKLLQQSGFPGMQVTVNLSSRQLQHPHLVEMVKQVLDETELQGRFLELDITENTAMQSMDMVVPKLNKLSDMGIQFSIDEFGTESSSLTRLKKLPVRTLKIGRALITDLTIDSDDRAIVNAVISMAHTLKLRVIAEGVETEEQFRYLNSSQCDEVQGFLFSQPVPEGALGELLFSCAHR